MRIFSIPNHTLDFALYCYLEGTGTNPGIVLIARNLLKINLIKKLTYRDYLPFWIYFRHEIKAPRKTNHQLFGGGFE